MKRMERGHKFHLESSHVASDGLHPCFGLVSRLLPLQLPEDPVSQGEVGTLVDSTSRNIDELLGVW